MKMSNFDSSPIAEDFYSKTSKFAMSNLYDMYHLHNLVRYPT